MTRSQHAAHCYTYDEYQAFPAEEQWEIIEGVAYHMTPAPSPLHQRIVNKLNNTIYNYLVQTGNPQFEVFIAPMDVYLTPVSASKPLTVVQPDLIVSTNPDCIKANGYYGAPAWVIEVLSPSTAGRDVISKRRLYEVNGVREYWIVDPTHNLVTRFYLYNNEYAKAEFFSQDNLIGSVVFPELSINLAHIFPATAE